MVKAPSTDMTSPPTRQKNAAFASTAPASWGFFSAYLRVLGTYPASPFRAQIAEPAENRTLRPQTPR